MERYSKVIIGFFFFALTILIFGIVRQFYLEKEIKLNQLRVSQDPAIQTTESYTEDQAEDTLLSENKDIEIIPVLGTASSSVPLAQYIEVIDSCGPYFESECLNARSGSGTHYPALIKLRKGVILKVAETVQTEAGVWYKIAFDEWLRYPERSRVPLYVSAQYVNLFEHIGIEEFTKGMVASTTKRIIVDRSEQMLYAYEGEELFMQEKISTGLELTPPPRGTFTIFRKTPTRYMQGPIPGISTKEYDLPGVPWNLYFTTEGAVIHGAYWHDNFGKSWSNGCVNLPPEKAKELYAWAELGMTVTVRD